MPLPLVRSSADICHWGATGVGGTSVTCSTASTACAEYQGKLAAITSVNENVRVGSIGG